MHRAEAEKLIDYHAANAGFNSRDYSTLMLKYLGTLVIFYPHQALRKRMPRPKDSIAFTEALADMIRL